MKTWNVEITKLPYGYYIIRRYGPNVVREWRKTMAEATALKKKWEAI